MTTSETTSGAVRIATHVITQGVSDETILLNTQTEAFISLNDVGAVIWNSLNASGDPERAVVAVAEAFDVDSLDDVRADVDAFVAQLVELGVAAVDA
jgi:Coenzyme PQQ synthesis protein D (PqqD)